MEYKFLLSVEGSATAIIEADSIAEAQAKFADGDWTIAKDDLDYRVEAINGELPPPEEEDDDC